MKYVYNRRKPASIVTNWSGVFFLSVIRHHDEHQRQEEGDQVYVQQAVPQAW